MISKFNRNYKYLILFLFTYGCGNYSFTGASIPEGTESFQVNLFENNAGNNVGSIFEPGLDRDFTIALQNILENQTNLQMFIKIWALGPRPLGPWAWAHGPVPKGPWALGPMGPWAQGPTDPGPGPGGQAGMVLWETNFGFSIFD